MNLSNLQKEVQNFVNDKQLETDIQSRMLDLVSEIGELAKEVIKASNYGKRGFTSTQSFSNELGDVLFSLICIANKTNNDLTECLTRVLQKYNNRFSTKGSIDSGK